MKCWFVGERCYCGYDGMDCIDDDSGMVTTCPADSSAAVVCRVDADGDANGVQFQCVVVDPPPPAGSTGQCGVMKCRYIILPTRPDHPYGHPYPKPGRREGNLRSMS